MNQFLRIAFAMLCTLAALSSCVHIRDAALTLAISSDLSCEVVYQGHVYSAEPDDERRRAEMHEFLETTDELASDVGEMFRLDGAAIDLVSRAETGCDLTLSAASEQFIDALNLFRAFGDEHPPIARVNGETLDIEIPVNPERARDEDTSRYLPLTSLVVSHPNGFVGHNAHAESSADAIPTLTWDISKVGDEPIRFTIALTDGAARSQALRLRPPAGTDLQELAARLEDGDRVQFAAGEYPGQLFLENKRVTITGATDGGSILTGPAGEDHPTVFVGEGGALWLTGIVLRAGREDGSALYVTGSPMSAAIDPDGYDIVLERCRFEGPAANGCIVRGPSLHVRECAFQQFTENAIYTDTSSLAEIADCSFTDLTGLGISIHDATVARITNCTFNRLPRGISIDTGPNPPAHTAAARFTYPVAITFNTFRNLPGDISSIVVKSGRRVNVSGNSLLDTGGGIGFMPQAGDDGQSRISDNTIIASRKGGIYVQARDYPAAVVIDDNFIIGPNDYGVLVNGGGNAAIAGNVVLGEAPAGIAIQNGAAAHVAGNYIITPDRAVVASNTDLAQITFEGNFVLGPCTLDIGIDADPMYGVTRYLDTHPGSREELVQKMVSTVSAYTAAAVREDAAASDAAELAWGDLSAAVAAIKREAASVASVGCKIIDAWGTELETGFGLLTEDESRIVASGEPGEMAQVDPGRYRLIPAGFDDLTQTVELAEGESITYEIRLPRAAGALMQYYHTEESSPDHFLLPLRDQRELREVLRRLYFRSFDRGTVYNRRAGVSAGQIEAGLELARMTLETVSLDPLNEGMDKGWGFELSDRMDSAFDYAARIVTLYGDESDVELLMSRGPLDEDLKRKIAAPVAAIENRLGRLEHGALRAKLDGDDPEWSIVAAAQMHHYGLDLGEEHLIRAVNDPANLFPAVYAARALMAKDGPEVLAAYRVLVSSIVVQCEESDETRSYMSEFIASSVLYLLAYGDESDVRLVSKIPFSAKAIGWLGYATDSPEALARVALLHDDYRALTGLASAYVAQKEENIGRIINTVRSMVYQRVYQHPPDPGIPANSQANVHADMYLGRTAHVRPSNIIADYACAWGADYPMRFYPARWGSLDGRADWIAQRFCDRMTFAQMSRDEAPALDMVSPELLAAALDRQGDAGHFWGREIFDASHALGSNANNPRGVLFSRHGEQRRPYIVTPPGAGGAISGLLEMRPALIGNTLRISLKIRQQPHYESAGLIDFDEGDITKRPIHQYVRDHGRAMIDQLILRRGERILDLVERPGQVPGEFIYEAALREPALSDLTLVVRLKCVETRKDFSFNLFAEHFARDLNRSRAEEAEARATLLKQPNDPDAHRSLGRALEIQGRIEPAWEAYRTALSIDSNDVSLWLHAADMFARFGHTRQELAVLKGAFEAQPGDPDIASRYADRCFTQGRFEEAAGAYGALFAGDEFDFFSAFHQGVALYLSGEAERAHAILKRVPAEELFDATCAVRYMVCMTGDLGLSDRAIEEEVEALRQAQEDMFPGPERMAVGVLLGLNDPRDVFPHCQSDRERMLVHCLTGYRHWIAGEAEEARTALQLALIHTDADPLFLALARHAWQKLAPVDGQ